MGVTDARPCVKIPILNLPARKYRSHARTSLMVNQRMIIVSVASLRQFLHRRRPSRRMSPGEIMPRFRMAINARQKKYTTVVLTNASSPNRRQVVKFASLSRMLISVDWLISHQHLSTTSSRLTTRRCWLKSKTRAWINRSHLTPRPQL